MQALVTTISVTPPIKRITVFIHTHKKRSGRKNSLFIKNIKHLQATQGCFHIKIVLQDKIFGIRRKKKKNSSFSFEGKGACMQELHMAEEHGESTLHGHTQCFKYTGMQHK